MIIGNKTRFVWACGLITMGMLFSLGVPSVLAGTDEAQTLIHEMPDALRDRYKGYTPPFLSLTAEKQPLAVSGAGMKLSREKSFFSQNLLYDSERATAFVQMALEREAKGKKREALKLYQTAIDRFPNEVFRVSEFGVFVPVSEYCQRRILGLGKETLEYFRTLYDSKARQAYETSMKQYSLVGYQEIVDTMLATSYGDDALLALGDAALGEGNFEQALEYYEKIRALFTGSNSDTPELRLKMKLCLKELNRKTTVPRSKAERKTALSPEHLAQFKKTVTEMKMGGAVQREQRVCAPHVSAEDYASFPPPVDRMALEEPVWEKRLSGANYLFSDPVVTQDSVLYRHKNVVYCRSILNGELRWTFDLGGQITWQNRAKGIYPLENLVVADGMVFTNVHKAGPSLVALDLITGQLKWAAGPMAPATELDTKIRFEAAPAVGPRSVFVGYVIDHIEGDTHSDTEYGVRAFEATTGRVLWDTSLCRLAPGKFTSGIAITHRNRIRSFSSPPVLHQGTLYYNTNAGAVAALNARSGRLRWIMRYPYWPSIHDATLPFGKFYRKSRNGHMMQQPGQWFNQRPFAVGDALIVAPVDSPALLSIDSATGKVNWTYKRRSDGTFTYVVGPTSCGELAVVSGRRSNPVHLLDGKTGKVTWKSGDLIKAESSPVMSTSEKVFRYPHFPIAIQERDFYLGARPFLTRDDELYVGAFDIISAGPNKRMVGFVSNMACVSLRERSILEQRRYYDPSILAAAHYLITEAAPEEAKKPHPATLLDQFRAVMNDRVPENRYGPFRPMNRMTFTRNGVPFELRMTSHSIAMLYEPSAVMNGLGKDQDPQSRFGRAEMHLLRGRAEEAAKELEICLKDIPSNELMFRAAVNQLLFQVQLNLSRKSIRCQHASKELASALRLWETAGTTSEQVLALFAMSEAYQRGGDTASAARCLRSIVRRYGRRSFHVSRLSQFDHATVKQTGNEVLDALSGHIHTVYYRKPFMGAAGLLRESLPLYWGAVSPLPKALTIEAGRLASARLLALYQTDSEFAMQAETLARSKLVGTEQNIEGMLGFPGTAMVHQQFTKLLDEAARKPSMAANKDCWALAEAMALGGFRVPAAHKARTEFKAFPVQPATLEKKQTAHDIDFSDAEGTLRMVLERRGDRTAHLDLVFVGGRARKRLDNKFELVCIDSKSGKRRWTTKSIRLKGTGQEPGFTEAFVHEDLVVVHGYHDVLAYRLTNGKECWRYRAPFNFEILHALKARNLMILAGKAQTLAIYLPTGEVVWEGQEEGEPYSAPYAVGETLVLLRHKPSSVVVRSLGTGRSQGRLRLPELTRRKTHPHVDGGRKVFPVAHHGYALVASDGWYYIKIDTRNLCIDWKRLIDSNDPGQVPALRFALNERYLLVLKKDYVEPAMHCLDARSGKLLWRTQAKNKKMVRPMYSPVLKDGKAYGIQAGQGRTFRMVGVDLATGKVDFSWESGNYDGSPDVRLARDVFGPFMVAHVADRQTFELVAFDTAQHKPMLRFKRKGQGPWGVHGKASATVQSGKLVLMTEQGLEIRGGTGGVK